MEPPLKVKPSGPFPGGPLMSGICMGPTGAEERKKNIV